MPAVVHENAAAGKGWVASPVWMIRIDRRAILDPQSFNPEFAQLANCAGAQRIRRPANDRGVFPVVNRNDGASGFARARSHFFQVRAIQQQRLFAQHVPAARNRFSHRLAMQGRRGADIDKVDFGFEFFYSRKSFHAGN